MTGEPGHNPHAFSEHERVHGRYRALRRDVCEVCGRGPTFVRVGKRRSCGSSNCNRILTERNAQGEQP